jgi:hypothetical protein
MESVDPSVHSRRDVRARGLDAQNWLIGDADMTMANPVLRRSESAFGAETRKAVARHR